MFALKYVRKSKSLSRDEFNVYHPLVREYLRKFGLQNESDLPEVFVTAHEIRPEFRVEMQATIQKHIDHAISSTVNLPEEITPEEVAKIYFLGWKLGCKGITVYREGSREGILLTEEEVERQRGTIGPRPRSQVVQGKTYRMRTEMGKLYVTINADEQGMLEVFANLGKSGSSAMAFTEAIGRLISLALRSGVKPAAVIDELSLIRGLRPVPQEDGTFVVSVPDAIAKAMEEYLKGGEQLALLEAVKPNPTGKHAPEARPNGHEPKREAELCPSCGGLLMFTNGCYVCSDCGFSECD
jgi:ribonucleoside-diphosphate reductase alpha chain